MEFDIVDAYLRKHNKKIIGWSIHVYIKDLDLNIRGIFAKKNGTKWFIMMPHTFGTCSINGNEIKFPIVSFDEVQKEKEFRKLLKHKAILFLEKKIFDLQQQKKENPDKENMRHLRKIKPKFNELPKQI